MRAGAGAGAGVPILSHKVNLTIDLPAKEQQDRNSRGPEHLVQQTHYISIKLLTYRPFPVQEINFSFI